MNLNDVWSTRVVDPLSKRQLKSKVDRIRIILLKCEMACKELRNTIPVNYPTPAQADIINTIVDKLLNEIRLLRPLVLSLGTDLDMATSANRIDDLLDDKINEKQRALFYVQEALRDSRSGAWNSADVLRYLSTGIDAFDQAKQAAAEFERKLA